MVTVLALLPDMPPQANHPAPPSRHSFCLSEVKKPHFFPASPTAWWSGASKGRYVLVAAGEQCWLELGSGTRPVDCGKSQARSQEHRLCSDLAPPQAAGTWWAPAAYRPFAGCWGHSREVDGPWEPHPGRDSKHADKGLDSRKCEEENTAEKCDGEGLGDLRSSRQVRGATFEAGTRQERASHAEIGVGGHAQARGGLRVWVLRQDTLGC